MEFLVLGPVEAREGDLRLEVSAGRQLALLALLLANANRVVPADRIVDDLWGERPPDSGVKAVAFHVSRLRDALAPERRHEPARDGAMGPLATENGGYVLHVEPGRLDASRFEQLAVEGRGAVGDDPARGREALVAALAMWRGRPYAQVADEPFIQSEVARLHELRRRTVEDLVEAELALGRTDAAVARCEALLEEDPLRERPRAQLMTALYRLGRQAEALRVFSEGRRLLAEELGIEPGPELRRLEGWVLNQDPRLDAPVVGAAIRNPYKGLRPFDEADAGDYFGREALVARLLEHLGRAARGGRLLVVAGASGSGKSSAIRAGLVPAVRSGALPGSDRWPIATMLPGTQPVRELAAALRLALPGLPDDLGARLDGTDPPGALASLVHGAVGDGRPVLLVVDQLEEVVTIAGTPEADRFLALLEGVLGSADPCLLVVASLRADHLAGLLDAPGIGERLRAATELVTPLRRDELDRAVARPAARVGVELEAGLAAEITADLAGQPGALPLLQFALTELFERREGGRMTRAAYAAIGGVGGALATSAEDAWAGLDADGRAMARQLFLRLVAPRESGEPSGRRVPLVELRSIAGAGAEIDAVLDQFTRSRLLALDRDAASGAAMVEVAHDALLTRWPRLAGWIQHARDDLSMRRRLADAAAEWQRSGRDPGFLLAGSRLALFEAWSAGTDLALDADELAFLGASAAERADRAREETERARRERSLERRASSRLRALVVVLAAGILLASALSVALYAQGVDTEERAQVALARERAAAATGAIRSDPHLAVLLALHAAAATSDRGYVTEEALDALHWSLQASHAAYPPGDTGFAVRTGLGGRAGVPLIDPATMMAAAAAAPGRDMTGAECRTYLHLEACPPRPAPPAAGRLQVLTGAGPEPVERLAATSLAGTHVDLVAQLPAAVLPAVAAAGGPTSIDVRVTGDDEHGSVLAARLEDGDLPDLAILARPGDLPALAGSELLVDLRGVVDDPALATAGDGYLAGLTRSAGAQDGGPPGARYAVPFAAAAESLVWYPAAAFRRAGYEVPATWEGLEELMRRMVADGRVPWCVGAGDAAGTRDAMAILESAMLDRAGTTGFDAWAARRLLFGSSEVRSAFGRLADVVFTEGHVAGGMRTALRLPAGIAAWPMLDEDPACWMHLGGGLEPLDWPAGEGDGVAAFALPPSTGRPPAQLGRVWSIVVFHDRPEVRRVVRALLAGDAGPEGRAILDRAGVLPLAATPSAATTRVVASALEAGAFRVRLGDLVEAGRGEAYERRMAQFLATGAPNLGQIVTAIDGDWQGDPWSVPGGPPLSGG